MNHHYTDEEIQRSVEGACDDINKTHPTTFGSLAADKRKNPSTWIAESVTRVEFLKSALARLPGPPPPVVDGKTPGQVAYEAFKMQPSLDWKDSSYQADFNRTASAVLAAFGGQKEQEEQNNYLEFYGQVCRALQKLDNGSVRYPTKEEVVTRLEELCQPTEVPWTPWNGDGQCPLKDEEVAEWQFKRRDGDLCQMKPTTKPSEAWWHDSGDRSDIIAYRVTKWREGFGPNVDWKAKCEEAREQSSKHLGWASEWQTRCAKEHARAEKAEAELAAVHSILDNDESKIIRNAKDGYPEGREDRVLTLAQRVNALCIYAADWKCWHEELEAKPKLSTLRPIAEAGEVPTGCFRWYGYYSKIHDCWFCDYTESCDVTHFADIRLQPEASHQLAQVWWKCHNIGASLQHGNIDTDVSFSVVCEQHGGQCFHADTPENAWLKAEKWLMSPDRANFPATLTKADQ